MMGHNSAGFGEQLRSDIETVLSDDHKKLFHYARWHLNDYIAGTEGMSLEAEGAYIRFLMRLYDRGKPFPDDDRFMSTLMRLSIRVWRRIRDSLVAIGKIIVKGGSLTNSRFEKERVKRAEELKKQAESARLRWEKERAKSKVSAKFAPSLDETSTKISDNLPKKPNEINETPITPHMPLKRLETREERKKEEPSFPPEPSPPVRERTNGRNFWNQTLNPTQAAAAKDVWWSDGRLEAAGAFLEELTGTLPKGLDLRTALDAAAGYVESYHSGLDLKKKVRAQFAIQVQRRVEQDRRYASAVASNAKRSNASDLTEKPADMPDVVWQRHLRAKENPC